MKSVPPLTAYRRNGRFQRGYVGALPVRLVEAPPPYAGPPAQDVPHHTRRLLELERRVDQEPAYLGWTPLQFALQELVVSQLPRRKEGR